MLKGLKSFYDIVGSDRVIYVLGDSIPATGNDPALVWPVKLRAALASVWGNGGEGFFPLYRPEWSTLTGTWTQLSAGDASNRAPWGQTWSANGSTHVKRFTLPAYVVTPTVTVEVLYVDGPAAADFSISADGAAFVNIGGTYSGSSILRKRTLTMAASSTIDVRAANAAGTGVATFFVGLRFLRTPGELVIENLGFPSIGLNNYVNRDATSYINLVQPDLMIMNESNDPVVATAEVWEPYQRLFWESYSGAAKLLIVDSEQGGGRDVEAQRTYRELTKNVVTQYGGEWLDMFKFWGTWEQGVALGFWELFAVHPNNAGYDDMTARILALLTRPSMGRRFRI